MRSEPHTNGNGVAANGSSHKSTRTRNRQEEETVRLIIQALGDMGYSNAVQTLSQESGVNVESALVEEFRNAVLLGDWATAERTVSHLELSRPEDEPHVLFLLREQKFLELLEAQVPDMALLTLRNELSPLKHNVDRLHFLSSLIMSTSVEDLRARANWSGVDGDSRRVLLRQLSSFISPNSMIPESRLAALLDRARQLQVDECLYHTSSNPISFLIPDHKCPRSVFPLHTSHVLQEQNDEVWHVQFSPSGRFLASTGASGLIVIYDARSMRVIHIMNRRTPEEIGRDDSKNVQKGVTYMTFSPDESTLMTCSQENTIVHWDVMTGRIINQFTNAHGSETVTSAAWLPSPDTGFISGGMDKKINLYDEKGGIIHTWEAGRIYDTKISPDGQYVVAISTDSGLYVFNMATKERISFLTLEFELTSISISKDSSRVLLSCSPSLSKNKSSPSKSQTMEVQEWSFPDLQLLRSLKGQKQGEFVIRSCYAGQAEQFVMSGSEDSDVYLWHRLTGTLLERIPGHSKSVGAVSWNPTRDQWASASDDHTVRVWEVERDISMKQDASEHEADQGEYDHHSLLNLPDMAQTNGQTTARPWNSIIGR